MSGSPSPLVGRGLTLGYTHRLIIDGLDVDIEHGAITTIIGPNGCGKSTLLRGLGRLLRPRRGEVLLNGKDIATLRSRDVARTLGVLPQSPTAPEGVTVADLVARGRHPHQSWLQQWTTDDDTGTAAALALTGMAELRDTPLDELSGGQRQRAWIAMALAQETAVLLLDEPTTYLDLAHAVEVLDLIDRLNRDLGRTVVMVLHDLNLAARYSDRIITMKDGMIVSVGRPAEVITEDHLASVFDLTATVLHDEYGTPTVVPVTARQRVAHDRGPTGEHPPRSDRVESRTPTQWCPQSGSNRRPADYKSESCTGFGAPSTAGDGSVMPYGELLGLVLHSLERARALEGIEIVRDLYADEVDRASRGLRQLILHPDHETGRVPTEVMREINTRYEDAWPTLVNHTDVVQR